MSESKVFLEVDGGDGEYPVFKVLKYITSASNVEVGYVLHQSIPQAEQEWSPDKFYDYYVAMYFGRIHNLELRHLDFDESVWLPCSGIETLPCNHMQADEQKWQLRKPQSIDDKIYDIITDDSMSKHFKIQAIKDVFKEQDAYWKRMEI